MSFPKKNKGKLHLFEKKRKWVIKYIISIFLALIILSICTPAAEAVDAEVYATLDEHKIEHILNYTSPNHIVVSGNITCIIEGLGVNIQKVEIDIWGSCQLYDYSVGPSHMTFTESGRKPFNLTITIPVTAKNNSKDTYSVTGHWQTQGSSYVIGDSGDITPDSVNVTVRRVGFVRGPQDTTPVYEELNPWWEELGLPNIAVIIFIIAIVIALILFFIRHRIKKRVE